MKDIKAVFQVGHVSPQQAGELVTLNVKPDVEGNSFSSGKITPSGQLTMFVTHADAKKFFLPGEEYKVVIAKVKKPAAVKAAPVKAKAKRKK